MGAFAIAPFRGPRSCRKQRWMVTHKMDVTNHPLLKWRAKAALLVLGGRPEGRR